MIRRLWWWTIVRCIARGKIRSEGIPVLDVPLRVDGEGGVTIGKNVSFGYHLAPRIGNGAILLQARTPDSVIEIGDKTFLSNNVSLVACREIRIGQECLIGDQTMIVDSDFHGWEPWRRREQGVVKQVNIGNNVWIGSRCIILRGVSIGDNSIIGAGMVIAQSIPPNSIVSMGATPKITDMSPLWDRL